MCSLSRVCGLLCRPPRMCRVGALYVMPFSKLKAWLKVWCVVVQQLLARPASVFVLSPFGLHDDNLSTLLIPESVGHMSRVLVLVTTTAIHAQLTSTLSFPAGYCCCTHIWAPLGNRGLRKTRLLRIAVST